MSVVSAVLVGRDDTREELRAALATTAGGLGACLVISGPAGIGKSRLLEAVADDAAALDLAVAAGRATELDRAAPLTTLASTLRGLRPPVFPAAGNRPDSPHRMVDQIGEAIEEYVRSQALLISIDDAQWADELSASALRLLVPALASMPVLWLLARRPSPVRSPGQDAIGWLIAEGAGEITLGPLADDTVAELCANLLGAQPDDAVLALAARGGGNPFLLEQLLLAARDTGQVLLDHGTARLVGDELPVGFVAAVDQRLRGLSADARRLLEVGSVLGRPFTVHAAAQLMGRPAVEIVPVADETVEAGALVADESELAFRHELLRQAVYDNLSGPARSALHREAAAVVRQEGRSPVEVIEHVIRGGQRGAPDTVPTLRQATGRIAHDAPGTAADLIIDTLPLLDDHDPGRPELTADAVRMLASAGRLVEASQLGEAALRAGLDPATEANLLLGLAEAGKHAGDNAGVVDYTARGLSAAGVSPAVRAQLLAIRSHALLCLNDMDEADRIGAEAATLGTTAAEHSASVFGTIARSVAARARGELTESVMHAREAVRIADEAGGEARHRHPRLWLACGLAALDRFDEADAAYSVAHRESEDLGTDWSKPLWHYFRASLLLSAGRLDGAEAEAEAGLRIGEQLAARQLSAPLMAVLARVAIHRDDLSAARAYLDRTKLLMADGVTVASEDPTWALAVYQDATGDPRAAAATLDEIYASPVAQMLLLTTEPSAAAHLVRIALANGSTDRAEVAVAAARRLAEPNPAVASLAGAAAHADGLLRGDVALLRSAVEWYRSSPRVLARAGALEDTATAERAAGNADRAAALLAEALEEYVSCGAERDAARLAKRLPGGVQRWRASVAGADRHGTGDGDLAESASMLALTPSERRVAGLVAEGLTNREVADRLRLSRHTVGSHLRHAFTKLGVRSRVELTRRLMAPDDAPANRH